MINVCFLIERTPKILVNVLKLLVYSAIKKKILRNPCWQGGAANPCFKALLEISSRTINAICFPPYSYRHIEVDIISPGDSFM